MTAFISYYKEAMNSADRKMMELDRSILQLQEDELEKDYGKNCQNDILMCFYRNFETKHHKGSVVISLAPKETTLDESTITCREMSFQYKNNDHAPISILHSSYNDKFLVHAGSLYYSSKAEDVAHRYPRARNANSLEEQRKYNKMVVQRARTMIKILHTRNDTIPKPTLNVIDILG